MKRFKELKDCFEVKCKKCGSVNVRISSDYCGSCEQNYVIATCDDCKYKFDSHLPEEIEDTNVYKK